MSGQKINKKEKIINEKELKDNITNIEKEIKSKKKIPKDENNKINKKVFENIVIAVAVSTYLLLVSLGSLNIETSAFLVDLKVFSVVLIVVTIMLFEYSYRKERGSICIHGIECFFLALFTLLSIYLYTMYFRDYQFIVSMASFAFSIYYVGKSIIIFIKMKRKYLAGINDISEIIKK